MPEYKLVYFDARGRCEFIRWMFKVADVEFEDHRLGQGEWPGAEKDAAPFGQLPLLYVDDKAYCQSWSIAKYLAREFDLGGKTPLEDLMVDQVGYGMDDFLRKVEPINFGKDPEIKAQKKKTFEEEQLPALFTCLEKLLVSNKGGNGWFVGDKISWADMAFAHFMTWLDIDTVAVSAPWEDFPKLQALKQRVEEHPRIARWLRTRPVTAN